MQATDGTILLSPTDLTGYLACAHLTTLALKVARGELVKPKSTEQAGLLYEKGNAHEAAYLESLRADRLDIREIEVDRGWEEAARMTREAIEEGVDVVYQGVFIDGRWRGQADFLMRTDEGMFEVLDTKLARSAKPAYILQLCFYNEQLARVQGTTPEHIHVLLGSGVRQSFRPQEFDAYARRVRRRFEEFVDSELLTEPVPCGHCEHCEFLPVCTAWWEEVDHLSQVAGCGRAQIERLVPAGISTLQALAEANPGDPPRGVNPQTFAKLQRQAALQRERSVSGELGYVLLEPQPERGLALLPEPSAGDIFFDIEGNPFWDERGSLEYLWGLLDSDASYTPLWAEDHPSERLAFEGFVDRVHARLAESPDMHVFHYASYEVAAIRRLAGRYGTREAEVDDLLRRGVLVDLLKAVRGGLTASVPGYGLKEMEAFLAFARDAEIRDGGSSVIEYERYMHTRDRSILEAIADYNREDCVATLGLRDWLLERRAEALARFGPFPLPEPKEIKPLTPEREQHQRLRDELMHSGDATLELAAGLLDYHDRERKPVWWAFFDRVELSAEELVEEAESIGLLTPLGEPERDKRSLRYRFRYPAQEHKLHNGERPFDPSTREHAGEIVDLDRDARVMTLKRGPSLAGIPPPTALIPGQPYSTRAQEDALQRIARSLLDRDRGYPAVESVLRREPFARNVQTTEFEEMMQLLLSLDGRHLVIQGPPGSGKTSLSGLLITRLLGEGKRVGVAATSHKAIHKLLSKVEEAGLAVPGIKKSSSGNPESIYDGGPQIESVDDRQACVDAPLSGGTAWLYAHGDFDGVLDYLFIDEAGQVSLADALAMGTSARNLVLVGDPQQLAQVLQGTHPDGVEASILQHLLGEHATIPPDRGLFLECTYRLHPDVCAYISEEFYDGRLHPDPICESRTTPLGTGLRFCPVEHSGCRQESPQEAERVAQEIEAMRAAGIAGGDIIVVAPYNAHVNLLRDRLPKEVRVGTVDKFQGQEALVAVYTMASSSGEEIPRGLEFLLSRNRLNVAISRAQCLAYLVCSPRLLEVSCRTIEQMRLANALCLFEELVEL